MPDSTPIYGFTYPCPGEVVDAADFALLGSQIDTVITAQDTAQTNALNRYNTGPVVGAPVSVTAGVATTLATPSYTFPVAGLWVVRGEVTAPFGTITSVRVSLVHNVTQFRGQTLAAAVVPWTAMMMVANAGDTAQVRVFYSGTPTPQDLFGTLTARLIALRN